MKKFIASLILFIFLIPFNIFADPGEPDTIKVDTVSGYPNEIIKLPIYFYNDEPLSGIEIVFEYDSTYLSIDTFSFDGGHLEFIDEQDIIYTNLPGKVHMLIYSLTDWIPIGHGLMCNLFFKSIDFAGNQIFDIDTTSMDYAHNWFADTLAQPIYPQFIPGYINVLEAPPSMDSVWVENVTGTAGETVEIDIYGFNEEMLDTLQLALGFSSENISFKDVIFDGTRGDLAQSTLVQAGLKQFLITLMYSESTPLTPGTGILAKVRFDISASAPGDIVTIDSVSYLGIQPLEFSIVDGDNITPFFIPGTLTINAGTPVDEDNKALLPTEFALKQNYPNPFNPSTTIEFDLPKASHVTLEVFNILGQKVVTLANRQMPAGRHQVIFSGRNENRQTLASGIYFYRLDAGNFSRSIKMILMK